VEWLDDIIMAAPTREHCLAKIAELEKKIEGCSKELLPDYLQALVSWRWLAERARQREGKD
jgi:hypothetical protein